MNDYIGNFDKNFDMSKMFGLEKEFFRFLKIKLYEKDFDEPFKLSISYPVDQYWHKLILDTKEYQNMCDKLGIFIHHNPKSGDYNKTERYKKTLELYEKLFNEKPNKNYWPSIEVECMKLIYFVKDCQIYVNQTLKDKITYKEIYKLSGEIVPNISQLSRIFLENELLKFTDDDLILKGENTFKII